MSIARHQYEDIENVDETLPPPGYPAELFYRGSAMFECLYGIVLAYPLVVWMFVPVYHRLEVTSVYEYLNMRFGSRLVRQLASATFIVRAVFNLAIIIYTPCVAMQTIMAVPFWASLLTLTGISICFAIFVHMISIQSVVFVHDTGTPSQLTAIRFSLQGGVKAAITADVIQGLTIIVVSIAVIIKGITLLDGGLMEIHETNRDDGECMNHTAMKILNACTHKNAINFTKHYVLYV